MIKNNNGVIVIPLMKVLFHYRGRKNYRMKAFIPLADFVRYRHQIQSASGQSAIYVAKIVIIT